MTQTDDVAQQIRDWFLIEVDGDPSIIDRMSEVELDQTLTAFGIDVSVFVVAERSLKGVMMPLKATLEPIISEILDTDPRSIALKAKWPLPEHHLRTVAQWDRLCDPVTLEEMEWSITMKPHLHFALPALRHARDQIEALEARGWINHGWFNASLIAGLFLADRTGLEAQIKQLKNGNKPHELIGFWFGDDDVRTYLLTPDYLAITKRLIENRDIAIADEPG